MKRILIVPHSGIGDYLFTVYAQRAIRKSYPEAEIYVITPKTSNRKYLFDVVDPSGEIQIIDRGKSSSIQTKESRERRIHLERELIGVAEEAATLDPGTDVGRVRLGELRDYYLGLKWEHSVHVDGSYGSAISNILETYFGSDYTSNEHFFYAAMTLFRVKPDWNAREIHHRTRDMCREQTHLIDCFGAMTEAIGAHNGMEPLDFGNFQPSEEPYLLFPGLHAETDSLGRFWPAENYREVARWAERKGLKCRIVAGGSLEERDYSEMVAEEIDVKLEHTKSLKQLIQTIQGAVCVVTCDGGTLHLSSFVHQKSPQAVLGLYGGTSHLSYAPQHHRGNVVSNYDSERRFPGLLRAIEPERVIAWLENNL